MSFPPSQLNSLIDFGAELVERGLVLGSGGNLSLSEGDTIHITRSGSLLHELTPEDFLPVDLNTPYRRTTDHPRPSTETPMHQAAYLARPDARVIVHCHPRHAIAWAMQGKPLPACTPDFALHLGPEVPSLPFFLPGSHSLSEAVARALVTCPALLLGNHGVLVTGSTIAQARLRTLHLDETAHICLLAAAAGRMSPLTSAEIEEIIATYGAKA